MKTCFKCQESKPLKDFYRHSGMADGRLGKCKGCAKKDALAHRESNLEKVREYDRKRGLTDKHKARVRAYSKTKRGKKALRKAKSVWDEKNLIKKATHAIVKRALQDGRLSKMPCEVCGTTKRIQGHHDDYSKPLDVRWLCVKHHAEHHRKERELARKK